MLTTYFSCLMLMDHIVKDDSEHVAAVKQNIPGINTTEKQGCLKKKI